MRLLSPTKLKVYAVSTLGILAGLSLTFNPFCWMVVDPQCTLLDKWCSGALNGGLGEYRHAALVEFFGQGWAGYSNPYLTVIGYVSLTVLILAVAYLALVVVTMLLHRRIRLLK
jgi:hypothetical protein